MIYVLQGALKVLVGGRAAAVHEGEVLLVPAGVRPRQRRSTTRS